MGIYRRVARDGRVTWYVRYHRAGREHRQAAGPTRAHAVALLARRLRERQEDRSGVHLRRRTAGHLVDLVVRYIGAAEVRGRRSITRMRQQEKHIRDNPLGEVDAARVSEDDLDAYVTTRRRNGASPATVNRELALVRAAMRWGERRGDLPRGSVPHVSLLPEPPGRCRVLSDDEEHRVMAVAPPWLRDLATLAVNTGCRQGELLDLRWRDVDLGGGWLRIEASKSGKRRDVPLNATARGVLEAQPRGVHGARVFPSRRGGRRSNSHVDHAWRAACDRAGVADCRWHDLRHTAGARVATATGSLLAVRDLLGHSTITMAQRYAHLAASSVRAAVDAIEPGQRTGNGIAGNGGEGAKRE